ncbi:protein kinase [Archangium minus]|uniref:Protein kinase n=2 Tax=Archangium minus TaxID=83450 RepID=A0ABY9X3S5_9BACT|nr:protein kinase [Archangium minus]
MTQQLGKYQLIRKLATGGMAEVFLAKAAGPMGFEKTLVLKRILPHLAEEPAFVEMFLSEAKLAAQLTHPNIVQIFDFGEADGAYFLAMEYIDGPNLRVLIKRASAQGRALPPAICARLIADACDGLAFAHDFVDPDSGETLGLIHRDISPDNILLSRQGSVKVVDFGIAKAAGQSHRTQSGVIKGKLAYMPPEQVRAKALDRRVDVYALGVVLYELLTARKPFDVDTDVGLMQAILFDPLVPATQYRPDLSQALLRILDKALAKDREQRYPDCLALQSDLEDFILSAGKPVKTQHVAQFIAQLSSGTDNPQPTPQSGTPRSGPKHSLTPAHTPAPVRTRSGELSFRDRETVRTPRPQALSPEVAAPKVVSDRETSPYIPPEETMPQAVSGPTGHMATREQLPAELPRRSGKWVSALAGVVLLGVGGAVVLWRTNSGSEPQAQPDVVVQSTRPATTPPPSTQATASEPTTQQPAPSQPAPAGTPPPSGQAEVTPNTKPSPVPEEQRPEQKPPEEKSPVIAAANPSGTKESPPAGTKPAQEGRVPRPPPRQASVAPAPPKVVAKGTIEFRIRPYATVFIDGRKLGDTPIPATELPVGRYTVKLVNPDIKKTVTQIVEVKAGQPTLIKLNLAEE